MHDEACGLVDDQQMFVLEGDPQIERLRDEALRCRRLELDLLPFPQPVGLLPGDPVDADLAGREQPLGRSAGADLIERREEPVEAKPRRIRRDADADQERGALLSESSSDPRRTATPTTIDASARLKAGHQRRSRKSVT